MSMHSSAIGINDYVAIVMPDGGLYTARRSELCDAAILAGMTGHDARVAAYVHAKSLHRLGPFDAGRWRGKITTDQIASMSADALRDAIDRGRAMAKWDKGDPGDSVVDDEVIDTPSEDKITPSQWWDAYLVSTFMHPIIDPGSERHVGIKIKSYAPYWVHALGRRVDKAVGNPRRSKVALAQCIDVVLRMSMSRGGWAHARLLAMTVADNADDADKAMAIVRAFLPPTGNGSTVRGQDEL
jgi:hypothetical protein